jgi:WD40 repeat protein
MNVDQAIAIIESVLAPKLLNYVQIEIVRGAIAGSTYQQIIDRTVVNTSANQARAGIDPAAAPEKARTSAEVETSKYKISYVKEAAAQLWQTLGQRLGQKVTKNNLAALLLWYSLQAETSWARTNPYINSNILNDRQSIDGDREFHQIGLNLGIEAIFYGRTEEITILTNACLIDRCRLIILLGMGGMGKTTLAWKIANQLNQQFDRTIWRSLLNAPTSEELCLDLLQCLRPQLVGDLPAAFESQIELLVTCLNQDRCLLVLDNVESILEGQVQCGQYLPGYDGYDRLLRALGELPHQSCAILTSREKPQTIARLEVTHPQLVRSLLIDGLKSAAAHQLVQAYGSPQIPAWMWQEVYDHYNGNPLALKIATIAAVEMTGGGEKVLELYPLMKQGQLKFRHIDDSLDRQFDRLSQVERQLVYWLAIEREPVTGSALKSNLMLLPAAPTSNDIGDLGGMINAFQSLSRRCVIAARAQTWSIQPIMTSYLTTKLIDRFVAELAPDAPITDLPQQFWHLNTYAMIKATTKDYLRQTQVKSILRPILDRLLKLWENRPNLHEHLRQILARWQTLSPIPAGYLAGNILNLLIELEPDRSLKDLDCSRLPIRSAYLADVTLKHVNFAAATFDRSVFTQAFGGIVVAVCHPHGDLVATGDANGDVSLWQIADGQRIALYQGHTNWTRSLAFNPEGTILASSSEDCTVRFWEIATGEQIAMLGPHTQHFRGISFSRDGQRFITGGDDCLVRIYDLPNLLADQSPTATVETHCLQSLAGHRNWVFAPIYSPDESRLASTSTDGDVRIWDLATGKCLQILPHEHWVIWAIFSPDGQQLIVCGTSATIYVWDVSTGKLLKTLTGHLDWVWSIALSADGQTLFSTGEDRTIRRWDLATGNCLSAIRAHKDRIWTIALTPDGQQLISGSEDRSIKIWDVPQGKCVKQIDGYGNWIKAIALIPGQELLVSGHRDCTIRLWHLPSRTCIHTLFGHTDAVMTIAVSPDGRYLASSSLDLTIRIWDLHDLTCLQMLLLRQDAASGIQFEGVCNLVFSPAGDKLISANHRGDLQTWDVLTGKLDRTLDLHPTRIQAVTACKVNQVIVTACENQIRIVNLHTGECLQEITAHDLPVMSIACSPDGRYLASGSMDKTVKIWETSQWKCVQTLIGHQNLIMTLAFSPTPITVGTNPEYQPESQLLVGSGDRQITRWNISTGECLQTYLGHTNWVWSIIYRPDGLGFISAGEDETIKIWEIDRPQALHTLQLQRPYEQINIAGVTGLKPGQIQTLKLLGAID